MTRRPESLLSRSRGRERLLAAGFLLPSFVLFGLFVFYPLARTAWLGLHQQDAFGGNEVYVGFSQYTDVLKSSELHHSMWITVQFVLIVVPAGLVLGTALAVLAHKPLKALGAFRTIFSSTIATSIAVASLLWLVLLNPSIGVLAKALPIHVLRNPGLLNSPSWALVSVSASTVWQNLRVHLRRDHGGLQSIPEELQESALSMELSLAAVRSVALPLLAHSPVRQRGADDRRLPELRSDRPALQGAVRSHRRDRVLDLRRSLSPISERRSAAGGHIDLAVPRDPGPRHSAGAVPRATRSLPGGELMAVVDESYGLRKGRPVHTAHRRSHRRGRTCVRDSDRRVQTG
jgi:ABC-type sugar transport system permease subunit